MIPKSNAIIATITATVAMITSFFIYSQLKASPNSKALRSLIPGQYVVSPTPMPFIELTVPYLRARSYDSTLANLTSPITHNGYTSYLTSYRSDGLRVNALLTKPTGEMPANGWPAIIFVHGYIPPSVYETRGQSYSAYVDYFARSGFVVLKIDLRGHGTSEGIAGGGYFGSDYVVDALNAYAAMQKSEFVNPKAIGMWGHSMAGNILMRSAVVKRDIPAIVIWAGAVYSYEDQRTYGIQDSSYRPPPDRIRIQNRRTQIVEKYGSPSAMNDFWKQVAPVYFLNDFKGAAQIHHAIDDNVVNIGYSRDLTAALDTTSVPHELHEYPDGGHNISGNSFNSAMQRSVDFFKKYLDQL